jgi:hypothetical protein
MQTNVQHIRQFIEFAGKELKLPQLPRIKLTGSQENRYDAFGHSKGSIIVVRITDRHPIDVMRTIAHEMLHYKQNVLGLRASENEREDQANVVAGRIMRKFDIAYPDVFKDKAVRANMFTEDVTGIAAAPVNTISGGGVATFDPLMQFKGKKKKELNTSSIFTRLPAKPLRKIIQDDK